MAGKTVPPGKLRSQLWFDDPDNPDMTALHLERYLNFGLTREELQSGRPIIGIAQTGSDLVPCNRHHIELAKRVKDGIREAGGVPLEFPVHPLQESGKRPTAALDRNLAYLGLVEVLYGYPLDGVVLTTGCDKTTPACLMAAATVDLPAIVLSGGPMLNGRFEGKPVGSGTVIWEARQRMARGEVDYEGCMRLVASGSPSVGHCNTMGTALSMNSLAEGLGMSLPGCAAIPGSYRERAQMAFETGQRAVEIVREDLRPSKVMTRPAFLNAIALSSALGGSSNCPPHLIAIARHVGAELSLNDWQDHGYNVPLLADVQPAGQYLGEEFHEAGGVPAVLSELARNGHLDTSVLTISGRSLSETLENAPSANGIAIRPYDDPLMTRAGFLVLSGSLFETGLMKTSVISDAFRGRFLSNPDDSNAFEGSAVVFEGPEDYRARIEDPELGVTEKSILIIRGAGPIGFPGSAEVVNMQPPANLIKRGITELPTIGDGRQSGTSASPSILNATPEAPLGGGLTLVRTGDRIRIDLNKRTADLLVDEAELEVRRQEPLPKWPDHQTPWQQIYRDHAGQLSTGGCFDFATEYKQILSTKGEPRDSH
ncbi:IlvD/Edd family dehydratase [Ruegeria sp. HKCCD8929]|uniref:IlvD/Edd family dehydratase n=1 Tax=Ruegeria sp. HKCCD8929 TaxID=2683006 RepID=UPI001C2C33E4|nr:IlvD/Edd family dehydratase [Ruegeria sp. HKCCD8929]